MRDHLATLLDDFRSYDRQIAVVRFQGNRRRATTYGQVAHLAGRFAALLAQRGIGPGDRVLLWGENGAEWIAAFHGCIARGVLAVPLDAYGTAEFAARVAADVKPKLAVGDALLLHQLPPEYSRLAFEDWPGALPSEIGSGDCFMETAADGTKYPGTVNFVFNTAPALESYQFDTDATATTAVYDANGVWDGRPGPNAQIMVPRGASKVTLTFWRPQRKAAPGEPASAGGWVDIGGLWYGVDVSPVYTSTNPNAPGSGTMKAAYFSVGTVTVCCVTT